MLKVTLVVLSALSLSSACHYSWVSVPGSLKQIDGGRINAVWGVNRFDAIYRLNDDGSSWTRVYGRLKHVSPGTGGVWGVNKHDYIYYKHGTILGGTGGLWQRIGGRLKQIDSGPDGVVYGVNKRNDIYCRTGINTKAGDYVGTGWRKIPGKLKYVSCNERVCWGVNRANQIYYRRLFGTPSNCRGAAWLAVPGRLAQIETSLFSEVWGVNRHGHIYYRTGIKSSIPQGTGWKRVPGGLKHVTNGYRGVRGVNRKNQIWHRK